MNLLHRPAAVLASGILFLSIVVGLAQPAQAADPWTCPSGGNPSLWNPALVTTPVQPEPVWGRTVELRYHTSTRCAWGRISNGSSGDSVWVDWSNNGGGSWRQLSVTRIPSGGSQVYTTAHNDAGYVMRACGKAGNRVEIVCTRWY